MKLPGLRTYHPPTCHSRRGGLSSFRAVVAPLAAAAALATLIITVAAGINSRAATLALAVTSNLLVLVTASLLVEPLLDEAYWRSRRRRSHAGNHDHA